MVREEVLARAAHLLWTILREGALAQAAHLLWTMVMRWQPRTPAPAPELNATQKWWAAFMGDRAFARARAAGKNETEAGHARAKAEADIALSLSAEYRD